MTAVPKGTIFMLTVITVRLSVDLKEDGTNALTIGSKIYSRAVGSTGGLVLNLRQVPLTVNWSLVSYCRSVLRSWSQMMEMHSSSHL